MSKTNILHGDCLETLKTLDDQSVNCCVTSPPYFGLRDYGMGKQIGLENTPSEYVKKLVEVFKEVKRVLKDDGTLWLNLGDSYSGSGKGRNADGSHQEGGKQGTSRGTTQGSLNKTITDLKPKNLIGIPWLVAFALQSDGWILRQDIIWHKPNPMPESVIDRCTKAHEYIFLLSKSQKYYFDSEAMQEPVSGKGNLAAVGARETRNKRSVWTVIAKPFKGAHFATFPEDLIRPCIMAGCPENGTVLDPFGGSGTVGVVAESSGRNAVLCELNEDYIKIANKRIDEGRDMFIGTEVHVG